MDAAFVGGAALGAAFGELFRAVREAKNSVSEFRPQFDKLSSTLARIRPIFEDVEMFNRVLDRVGEMDRIQEMITTGVNLVKTSAKVGKINVVKKYKYSKKLEELNKSIAEFLTLDAPAAMLRDVKWLSQEVKMLTSTLEAIYVNGSMVQSGGGYFVDNLIPRAPEVVIGDDANLADQLRRDVTVPTLTPEQTEAFDVARYRIELLTTVLSSSPQQDALKDDSTTTLVHECHQSQYTVERIIEAAEDDEALLFEALNVNDEIQKVLEKHEEMQKSVSGGCFIRGRA